MVANMSDEEIWRLNRGGHDPQKVYAAYAAAVAHKGAPTVILAKTVKGFGLGKAAEGLNVAHQQKKLDEESLQGLARPIQHPDLRRGDRGPVVPQAGAGQRGDALPARAARRRSAATCRRATGDAPPLAVPPLEAFKALLEGTRRPRDLDDHGARAHPDDAASRTRTSASTSCRSFRTRRVPSAWRACSARSASIRRSASSTRRRTPIS